MSNLCSCVGGLIVRVFARLVVKMLSEILKRERAGYWQVKAGPGPKRTQKRAITKEKVQGPPLGPKPGPAQRALGRAVQPPQQRKENGKP